MRDRTILISLTLYGGYGKPEARLPYSRASGWMLASPSPVVFFYQYFLTQASYLVPAAASRPVKASAAISAYGIFNRLLESFGSTRTNEVARESPVERS